MAQIGIVTDDLTSATDGAGAFAERGWSVRVLTRRRRASNRHDADVLAVDAASRTLSVREAIESVRAAVSTVVGCPTLVKQFDSTLRGHVAAETIAILRATERRQIVVAAAFPSAGRVSIGGQQHVNGLPVHMSPYASDILNPVPSSDLCGLFAAEDVSVSANRAVDATVQVLDAQSETELDAIVDEYLGNEQVLLAGSTGLVRALARRLPQPPARERRARERRNKVLVVVGSMNANSRRQLEMLGSTGVVVIELDGLVPPDAVTDRISRVFAGGRDAVALASGDSIGDPQQVSTDLGQVASALVRRRVIDGMIVTGGDTLSSILDHLDVGTLQVCGEIEPGVPICMVEEPCRLSVVTKAGGFGTPEVFLKGLSELQH